MLEQQSEKNKNLDLHCIFQLMGVIDGSQHQQTQDDAPEVPTQLGGKLISQILQGRNKMEGGGLN